MTKYPSLLWVDLEMTGLEPATDRILEVAAIATDWNFKEYGSHEAIIHQPDTVLDTMQAFSQRQHGASGLTEACRRSTIDESAAEAAVIAFIDQHFKAGEPVVLAGNSIHQDRRFIRQYWPALEARLHYRMLDVSAWKVVFEGKYRKRFIKPEKHRALEDIRGSIEELAYYLQQPRG